ncbi:MAG: hypothetical protein AMXMBFR33_52440 [Candidatus Xenobia bacterium]
MFVHVVRDAHTHFLSYSFFQKLALEAGLIEPDGTGSVAQAGERLGWEMPDPDPAWLAGRWVSEMDKNRVSQSIIFGSLPDEEYPVGAACRAYRDRLIGFAMVNPVGSDKVEAVQRVVDQGLKGILLFPAMHGYRASDRALYPLYEAADEHRLCIFVHCGALKVAFRTRMGLSSAFSGEMANPIELQKPAASFPNIRFIVPHLGSGMLRELLMLADMCDNVYTDTSGIGGWARYLPELTAVTALKKVVEVMGVERILFGSDSSFFPRGFRTDVVQQQLEVFAQAGFGHGELEKVLGGNLQRVLGQMVPA